MELSNARKSVATPFAELLRPVWSKQHGAYITLITSWLVGVLLSQSVSIMHAVTVVLLLSGFNCAELITETAKRRSPQSQRKLTWMALYSIICAVTAYVLWMQSPLFRTMLPVLIGGWVLYFYLSIKRLQKTIPAEVMTFMLFSAAGLLAYNPTQTPDAGFVFRLWIMLTAFFCLSVFHVKYRIKEITVKPLIGYVIISLAMVFLADRFSTTSLLVSTLIVCKTVPLVASPETYRALQIKHIGYLEMVTQGMLVLIIVLTL